MNNPSSLEPIEKTLPKQPLSRYNAEKSLKSRATRDESEAQNAKHNSINPENYPSYADYLASDCRDTQKAVADTYAYFAVYEKNPKVNRLRECRKYAFFCRHAETGKVRVAANSCKLRWCPLCQKSKYAVIVENATLWLSQAKHPKMVTFTLKHTDATLSEQLERLRKSFINLRKRKFWKTCVTGGIWFTEITFNQVTGCWHSHLHVLCDGSYMPQKKLSREWLTVTGDSPIIDIRAIKNKNKMAKYVAKYVAKIMDILALQPQQRIELFAAVHGKHTAGTFGSARYIKLTTSPPEDKHKWHKIGSWAQILNLAPYDKQARSVLRAWQTGDSIDFIPNISDYFTTQPVHEAMPNSPPIAKITEYEQRLLF